MYVCNYIIYVHISYIHTYTCTHKIHTNKRRRHALALKRATH